MQYFSYFIFTYFHFQIISVFSKTIILPKRQASSFLDHNRIKRDNSNFFEETFSKDNLERECLKQSCNSEELMEIWKNAPSRPEIVGGLEKYNILRTELRRIRDFLENSDI